MGGGPARSGGEGAADGRTVAGGRATAHMLAMAISGGVHSSTSIA